MDHSINGIQYSYDESLVRLVPEGKASLTAYERHALNLLDEGISLEAQAEWNTDVLTDLADLDNVDFEVYNG